MSEIVAFWDRPVDAWKDYGRVRGIGNQSQEQQVDWSAAIKRLNAYNRGLLSPAYFSASAG